MKEDDAEKSLPWWKFWHVWLVIAGPALVVLASLTTFYIAWRMPDPLVSEDYYRQGVEINKTLEAAAASSLAPALQARNHAATTGLSQGKPVTQR